MKKLFYFEADYFSLAGKGYYLDWQLDEKIKHGWRVKQEEFVGSDRYHLNLTRGKLSCSILCLSVWAGESYGFDKGDIENRKIEKILLKNSYLIGGDESLKYFEDIDFRTFFDYQKTKETVISISSKVSDITMISEVFSYVENANIKALGELLDKVNYVMVWPRMRECCYMFTNNSDSVLAEFEAEDITLCNEKFY